MFVDIFVENTYPYIKPLRLKIMSQVFKQYGTVGVGVGVGDKPGVGVGVEDKPGVGVGVGVGQGTIPSI
jgi:hypothetical protein